MLPQKAPSDSTQSQVNDPSLRRERGRSSPFIDPLSRRRREEEMLMFFFTTKENAFYALLGALVLRSSLLPSSCSHLDLISVVVHICEQVQGSPKKGSVTILQGHFRRKGRSGKLEPERNSPNLGPTFLSIPVEERGRDPTHGHFIMHFSSSREPPPYASQIQKSSTSLKQLKSVRLLSSVLANRPTRLDNVSVP